MLCQLSLAHLAVGPDVFENQRAVQVAVSAFEIHEDSHVGFRGQLHIPKMRQVGAGRVNA